MNEIYTCKRIYKVLLEDVEKGDPEWKAAKFMEDVISPWRFFLSDVVSWGLYMEEEELYRNKEEKIEIRFKEANPMLIICTLEEFDNKMTSYYNSIVQFKQN